MSMFAKVLCPVDFSDVSATIAATAREIALGFGAEVLVVYVAPFGAKDQIMNLPADLWPKVVSSVVSSAEKKMSEFVARHFSGVKASGKVISGDPANSILDLSQTEGADLVVMATHGRQGFNRLVFGSVAEKVVKLATMPVITVRPRQ